VASRRDSSAENPHTKPEAPFFAMGFRDDFDYSPPGFVDVIQFVDLKTGNHSKVDVAI
jgi:hypothetical protein